MDKFGDPEALTGQVRLLEGNCQPVLFTALTSPLTRVETHQVAALVSELETTKAELVCVTIRVSRKLGACGT